MSQLSGLPLRSFPRRLSWWFRLASHDHLFFQGRLENDACHSAHGSLCCVPAYVKVPCVWTSACSAKPSSNLWYLTLLSDPVLWEPWAYPPPLCTIYRYHSRGMHGGLPACLCGVELNLVPPPPNLPSPYGSAFINDFLSSIFQKLTSLQRAFT